MKNIQDGSRTLNSFTNLYSKLVYEFKKLYQETTYKNIPIRRIGISFERLQECRNEQINLFENIENNDKKKKIEKSIIQIKAKMGKNSIIRGMDLEEGATTMVRNKLIGGHNGY